MKGGSFLLVLLFTVAALAGCADSVPEDVPLPSGDGDGGTSDAPDGGADPGARPTWTHGDWWQYKILYDQGFGEPLFDAQDKIVVANVGTGYTLASGGRDLAVLEAEFDPFFVGPIDKDLTGPNGFLGEPFQMFDWPLADGKSWQATVEETDLEDGSSVAAPIVLTTVADGQTFRIQGVTAAGTEISYTYDAASEWISTFRWVRPDGLVMLSMDLQESGAGYEGTFTQVELFPLLERTVISPFFAFDPSMAPTPDTVTLSADYTFVLRVVALFRFDYEFPPAPAPAPGAGTAAVAIQGPGTDPPETFSDPGTGNGFSVDIAFLEGYEPGAYQVGYALPGNGVGAFVMYHAFAETVTEFTAASHQNHG